MDSASRSSSTRKSSSSSSKSRHHDRRDRDEEDRHRSRHHHHHHKSSHSSSRHGKDKHKSKSSKSRKEGDPEKTVDHDYDDNDDEDMWVEKAITGVDPAPVQTEAPQASLTAGGSADTESQEPDAEKATDSGPKRDSWMMDDGGMDFGLMGALKVKKPKVDKPDPEKLQVSSRELNVHLKAGLHVDQYPVNEKPSFAFGDAGSSWRMTKLKRVMETAAEEGVAPEVVGVERYGSIEKYREALEERKELDRKMSKKRDRRDDRRDDSRDSRDSRGNRDDRRRDRDEDDYGRSRNDRPSKSGRHSEFSSAASSPFQRPMDEQERLEKELARRIKEKEREKEQERRYTPIPSPFATHVSSPIPSHSSEPVLTPDQLNKLKAKSIRAKMMGLPDAEELEKEYEQAQKAAAEAALRPQTADTQSQQRLVVVQTMGRSSGSSSPAPLGPGNSKAPGKNKKEITHDEQGNRTAYQGEETELDLHELVRREKMGLEEGMDQELARRITRDAVFRDDNDYMDDNADRIARTVKKTDAQLKSSAIHDHRKTQTALDKCALCFKDEGRTPPAVAVVSMGTRVYLGLPQNKEFLPGHCMIVPIQHVTSTLECDDDAWDEIRNFMKCLIQMNAAEDKAVIFSETVINLKWQKHSEAILSADEEWSQHKKLIETDTKLAGNGGFRKRLTSKMPFFHVWFGSPDKGYGHVIENADMFEEYFVKEVLASICEMDSSQWSRRNQKRIPLADNSRRVEAFKKSWQAWDWTRTLEK
ncbi:hypothetical protein KVV02_001256 [Mortierella alpina]|uniref:Cell cycle control protein cwf19 n=1 Tax=Mortierella alpina TaxID=64518 RepID=A0A9P8A4Z8_MORAP|nr:hypothetical protein KVV02_001256 [Mortierella alpina]